MFLYTVSELEEGTLLFLEGRVSFDIFERCLSISVHLCRVCSLKVPTYMIHNRCFSVIPKS